jgi:hypothetical protein
MRAEGLSTVSIRGCWSREGRGRENHGIVRSHTRAERIVGYLERFRVCVAEQVETLGDYLYSTSVVKGRSRSVPKLVHRYIGRDLSGV